MQLLPTHLSVILALSGRLLAAETETVFLGLGQLDGAIKTSVANGISADGTSICGISESSNGPEAFRWQSATGIVGIGDLANSPFKSEAKAISSDGSFAAGTGALGTQKRAARWIIGSSATSLGTLNTTEPLRISDGRGMSDDGLKIVGTTTPIPLRAFLWTSSSGGSSGTMTSLGFLRPGSSNINSQAEGISGDGQVVVGWSFYSITTPNPGNPDFPIVVEQGTEAFRWTQADGMEGLGDLNEDDFSSIAFAASEDGSTIVGSGSSTTSDTEGVIWSDGLIQSVGDLPGGQTNCRLLDVSADGSLAVGQGEDLAGPAAVIWDEVNGLRKLSNILNARNIDTTGWLLTSVVGISANGDVITGNGLNPSGEPEAWVINGAQDLFLPTPPPTPSATSLTLELGYLVSYPTTPGNNYQLLVSEGGNDAAPLGISHSTIGAANPSIFAVIDPSGAGENRTYEVVLLPGSVSNDGPPDATPSEGALLSFSTEPGFVYQTEMSDALSTWEDILEPIDSRADLTPQLHALPLPITGAGTTRFYRLTIEDAP